MEYVNRSPIRFAPDEIAEELVGIDGVAALENFFAIFFSFEMSVVFISQLISKYFSPGELQNIAVS